MASMRPSKSTKPEAAPKGASKATKPRKRATRARARRSGPLDAEHGVATFLSALKGKNDWYPALLDVVGRWVEAEETVDGELYRYLIGGEAFDWLRLAERLLEVAGDFVPVEEAERLLLFGLAPDGSSEEEFARMVGPEKHRAHLNFQYGIVVEEALLLAAESELNKVGALSGSSDALADVAAYERVYGRPFDELLGMYGAETGEPAGEKMSVAEMQAFTYWCSKYRFRMGEPARVASDTRKALALLSTMESSRARLGGLSLDGVKEIVVKG
ncbi:MAG: hypothetical protein QF664_01090 [Dehalococcoidia bacterium]|jgi:hypothetical protein|nr:hypothetical protein [Dehalococcoidia bacterium]